MFPVHISAPENFIGGVGTYIGGYAYFISGFITFISDNLLLEKLSPRSIILLPAVRNS
jgi:hypothetical protein